MKDQIIKIVSLKSTIHRVRKTGVAAGLEVDDSKGILSAWAGDWKIKVSPVSIENIGIIEKHLIEKFKIKRK